METIKKLANGDKKTMGNHKVITNGRKRSFIYFDTAICKVNDETRTFIIDASYGSASTTRACNAYRKYFASMGYTELQAAA